MFVKITQTFLFLIIMSNFSYAESDTRFDQMIDAFSNAKRLLTEETPELFVTCRSVKNELLHEEFRGTDMGIMYRAEWKMMRKGNEWRTEGMCLEQRSVDKDVLDGVIVRILKNGDGLEYKDFANWCIVLPLSRFENMFQEWDYFTRAGYGFSETIYKSNKGDFNELQARAKYLTPLATLLTPTMPDSLIQNRGQYFIHDKKEKIDGFDCLVVEWPFRDKLWIDMEHGCLLRKHLVWYQQEKAREMEVVNRDFREIKPGLWLPMTQVVTKFGNINAVELLDKPLWRITYSVTKCEIGNISEDMFSITPPVGMRVFDVVRGGENYTITDEGADPFAGPIGQGIKVRRFIIVRSLLIICGSVLIFIALWRMLDKKEKENEKKP